MFDGSINPVPRREGKPRPWPRELVAILAIRHINLARN